MDLLVLWAVAEDSIVALLFCTDRTLHSKNESKSENYKLEENKTILFVMYITEEMQNIIEE